MLKPKKRMRRVINQLRKLYPGKWTYEYPCYWRSDTMTVTAYSVSAASYPDDDSTFMTQYMDQDGNVIILDQSFRTYQV